MGEPLESNSSDYLTLEDIDRMFAAFKHRENETIPSTDPKSNLEVKTKKKKRIKNGRLKRRVKRVYFTDKGTNLLDVTVHSYPPMPVPKEIRSAILSRDKRCQHCGTKRGPLDVHHKDWDHDNNELENLILLCRSCHSQQKKEII